MDADTLKTLVSIASAVVAVIGAISAQKSRVLARKDSFSGHKDSLILAMADNDAKCENLKLQIAFSREELEPLSRHNDENISRQAAEFLQNLDEMTAVAEVSHLRQYDSKKIDDLAYSEEALSSVRDMARGEQVNGKFLASKAYDLVFANIQKFVLQHTSAA